MDIAPTLRILGFVYLVLPVSVWFVLVGKHPTRNLAAWCLGAMAFGIGSLLSGLRHGTPPLLAFEASQLLVISSYILRTGALELEMDRDPRWRRKAAVFGLATLAYGAADWVAEPVRQLAYFALLWGVSARFAWTAGQVWYVTRLRSSRLIAGSYAILLVAATFGIAQTVAGGGPMLMRGDDAATAITLACGVVAALLGSLGYVGLAVERSHRHDLQLAKELEREATRRQWAEQHATQLQSWLEEREELVRLLAHEVRQPLNNAMAALHATHHALAAKDQDFAAVSHRVRRAEDVLSGITSALDNTLAATALLASPDRVEPRDVDVDTVIALSVGDLSPELRRRVQVQRLSQVRTATMDAGLMRLALRNLLSNAGAYTPPRTPIVLRVSDSDDPLGLIFAVVDQGPGIAPELASKLFERGVRGQRDGGGHGLGLYVVRRVMELHGGSVDLSANPGGGAIFRLTLPQTDEAYSAPMPLR